MANCGILLNDGTSFLMLNDGTSFVLLNDNTCTSEPGTDGDDEIRTGLPLLDILGDNRGTGRHKRSTVIDVAQPSIHKPVPRQEFKTSRQKEEDERLEREAREEEERLEAERKVAEERLRQKREVAELKARISKKLRAEIEGLEAQLATAEEALREAQIRNLELYHRLMLEDEEESLLMLIAMH
jgi:hypothetical protein